MVDLTIKRKGILVYRINEDGILCKICHCCKEYFPLSKEYFNVNTNSNGKVRFVARCRKCLTNSKSFDEITRSKPKHNTVNWDGELLICKKCNIAKSPDLFCDDKREKYRNFKSVYCRDCCNIFSKERLIKKSKENDLDYYLARLYYGLTNTIKSQKRSKLKLLDFDILKKDLLDLYNKQNGKCVLTGITMTYIVGKGANSRIKTNISIDRINSNIGYIKENIQLVCTIVNTMKSDLTIEELKYYCSKILENEKI